MVVVYMLGGDDFVVFVIDVMFDVFDCVFECDIF